MGRSTIWERPGGGIEVGQQPWELRRQARHSRAEHSRELDAKAIQAELTSRAAKLVMTRHKAAQMRQRLTNRDELTRDLMSEVHQANDRLLALCRTDPNQRDSFRHLSGSLLMFAFLSPT